jgi:hypothetical protein
MLTVPAAADAFFEVNPHEFDPGDTSTVHSAWLAGIGCVDCAPAPADLKNKGLLLVKSGFTGTFASATASFQNENGIELTELGYDHRDGTHCGAGAPRFNVRLKDDPTIYFIGCSSPAPSSSVPAGTGFTRKTWDAAKLATLGILPGNKVDRISIVFDEAQDSGEGLAIIDNININGTLVGK